MRENPSAHIPPHPHTGVRVHHVRPSPMHTVDGEPFVEPRADPGFVRWSDRAPAEGIINGIAISIFAFGCAAVGFVIGALFF